MSESDQSISLNAAQCARIALYIAQDCQTLVWLEPTSFRDIVALRRAGDNAPACYIDRDGLMLARLPMRLTA